MKFFNPLLESTLYILIIISSVFFSLNSLYSDFQILGGFVVNQNSGNINFYTNNNGSPNIVMTKDGYLGIGVASPLSTIEVSGSIGYNTESVSSDMILSGNSLVLCDTSSANVTLTLPLAATVMGRVYQVKKISDSNILMVTASGSDNIDKSSSISLTSITTGFPYVNLISSGGNWFITSKSDD